MKLFPGTRYLVRTLVTLPGDEFLRPFSTRFFGGNRWLGVMWLLFTMMATFVVFTSVRFSPAVVDRIFALAGSPSIVWFSFTAVSNLLDVHIVIALFMGVRLGVFLHSEAYRRDVGSTLIAPSQVLRSLAGIYVLIAALLHPIIWLLSASLYLLLSSGQQTLLGALFPSFNPMWGDTMPFPLQIFAEIGNHLARITHLLAFLAIGALAFTRSKTTGRAVAVTIALCFGIGMFQDLLQGILDYLTLTLVPTITGVAFWQLFGFVYALAYFLVLEVLTGRFIKHQEILAKFAFESEET